MSIYIRTVVYIFLFTRINTNDNRIDETEYGANLITTTAVQKNV